MEDVIYPLYEDMHCLKKTVSDKTDNIEKYLCSRKGNRVDYKAPFTYYKKMSINHTVN